MLSVQNDKKKLQELSCEVQRKEAWLQEERTEREKLEAELESEQECNRVSQSSNLYHSVFTNSHTGFREQ